MSLSARNAGAPMLGVIMLLGALSAIPPLSIDIGLPALPSLAVDLGVPAAAATQTLSVFLLGFTAGPLLFGPLSDQYGRRPILIWALAAYLLAAIGCAVAPGFALLLACRGVQGVAAGAVGVLPVAIVRDMFSGTEGRRQQAYVSLINSVGPLVAPLLGAAVLAVAPWRGIYVGLAVAGAILLAASARGYRETLAVRSPSGPWRIVNGFGEVARSRRFNVAALLRGFTFAGMFAYISASPVVFMAHYGLSTGGFALLFAFNALGNMAGAMASGRLAGWRVRSTRIIGWGVAGSCVASVGIVIVTRSTSDAMALLMALVIVNNICAGLVVPNAIHTALEDLGHAAGTGAALMRAMQMLFGAMSSALVALLGERIGLVAMGTVMAGSAFCAAACFLLGRAELEERPTSDDAEQAPAAALAESGM